MPRASRIALSVVAALALLLLTHYPLLRLPFYWDELGQFVPTALDIFHSWAWVPYTAVPNVHPPGLMFVLAMSWRIVGYSVLNTRFVMLGVAACALVAQWKLARTLTGKTGPAWFATLFLFCCPLFFAQAEMAQLDMPAMLLTTAALALFFEKRFLLAAFACCAAVMTKETAVLAPAIFGFLLLQRGRIRTALIFALPVVPLCLWLALLKHTTGHLFGSPEFTDYNLFYPLNPVRLSLALVRRIYYLFIGSGHFIGTIALVLWLRFRPLTNRWRIAFAFVGLHIVLISVLGGAVLERYLLPALPVLYSAFAAALWTLPRKVRNLAALALTACFLIACAVNPPYPFPMENNLAWTTSVTLQKQASEYVEAALPNRTIATTFPYAGGLRRPELGYVAKPLQVLEINDFRESNLTAKVRDRADALILYSTLWDPDGILQHPWLASLLTRYYGYIPQAAPADVPRLTGMRSAFRLCGAGQCVEVFSKRNERAALTELNSPTLGDENR